MAKQLEPYIGPIAQRPSPNHGYEGVGPIWRAVTWHISQGTLDSTLDWLCDPASDASAHYVIARNGDIYQLVSLDNAAWAQGKVNKPDLGNPIVRQTVEAGINPNLRSYVIECVGYSQYGHAGALTTDQALSLQRATAYLCYRSRLTADRTHILGHYQWNDVDRPYCPGYAADEWAEWVGRVNALCRLWRGW